MSLTDEITDSLSASAFRFAENMGGLVMGVDMKSDTCWLVEGVLAENASHNVEQCTDGILSVEFGS